MTAVPDVARNPLLALAGFMLLGLGGLVLVAGAVASAGRLLVVGVGSAMAVGGIALVTMSRVKLADEELDA